MGLKTPSGHTILAPVPKTIGWKLQLWFWTLLWYAQPIEEAKTWEQFYYGLISHKCEFDYENVYKDRYFHYCRCKHYGCNVVTLKDAEGKWLNPAIQGASDELEIRK